MRVSGGSLEPGAEAQRTGCESGARAWGSVTALGVERGAARADPEDLQVSRLPQGPPESLSFKV